jgi:hypothetical protein
MEKALILVWLLGMITGITALLFANKHLRTKEKEKHV